MHMPLQVRVVGGSNLRAMDKSGSSDPYAEVFVWCPGDATCEHPTPTPTPTPYPYPPCPCPYP
jgi:hypothetical protein